MGWISFWGVAAVQWLASVLSIWCLTILRLIVQAWPAVALVGLVRRRAAARVLGIAVGAAVADVGVSAVAAVERVGMKAVLSWQATGGGVAAIVLALVVAALSLWACWPFVRCVPGMPARIRRLGWAFAGGRGRRDGLPAAVPGASPAALDEREDLALFGRRSRALPGRGRVPDEVLAFAALPAEAAPGREVQPVPPAPRRPEVPNTVPPSPRDPRKEPPWTSAPSAVPFSGASPPSVPGRRGRHAAPEPLLESA
jgi:hypothetical protein